MGNFAQQRFLGFEIKSHHDPSVISVSTLDPANSQLDSRGLLTAPELLAFRFAQAQVLVRPSTLVVFATVAGSSVIGLLLYAGLFYANARRSTSAPEAETILPDYPSKDAAQAASERWIREGGDFSVSTTQRTRRSVPLSKQERLKLEMLADERRRAQIEADYAECLDLAENDLAKELCSFQQTSDLPQGQSSRSDEAKIPKTKVIDDIDVVVSKEPRRSCTFVEDYRRINCVELAISRDQLIKDSKRESLEIKTYKQFRY